ncbi:MAG TPA: M56 family metallopeptidase [Thermoanaerobaculia bacterium]|nr:M56 family metallopeptidase [Thermoanaerobaculia bacterium]
MKTLEALALTFLLNSLWQVPAVVLAAALGERLLRRGPARLRHMLWTIALAACVLLPAASLLPEAPAAAPPAPELPVQILAAPAAEPQPAPEDRPVLPPAALSIVAILYGAFVLGQGVRLARSWRRARALVREAWPPPLSEEALSIAARCGEAFGLDGVALLVSDRIPGPVTVGALRPVILLPPAFLENSTPDELVSTLGHEMAHVRRRDYALHLAAEALLVPVSFHPAVRHLRRRLAETREMACDEATVERLIGARAYARSLLSLAASIAGLPRPVFTLGVHDADLLEERMKRLTDPRSSLGARPALASLAVALLLLAGTGIAASSLALNSPAAPAGAAQKSWEPFLGVWHSEIPGTDLEIRVTNGQPEAILTMSSHAVPAYDLRVDGKTLTYRFRTALQYKDGGRRVILEHTNRLELTGEDEAVIRSLGGKTAEDMSQVPPPPPPQTARRVR